MNAGLVLAIDQSTSATKALLFDAQGILLDSEALPHRQIYPFPGWVEHDAAEIWENTLSAARGLLARYADDLANLLALALTNQRETFVIFDRDSGEPLYNAIVWQCRRGEPLCRRLMEKGHGGLVHQRTGLRIDTYFPASKIAWLLAERPDLRARLADGSALLGTIDTYLLYRLTNGRTYATEHTNASRTLLYDIRRLRWDPDLAALFGVPLVALPEIRSADAHFGETDLGGLLPRALPICGVLGDSQAALFAERCYTPGSAKVTFGSGSSVLLNTGSEPRSSEGGILTAVAWVLGGRPTYALEGIINYTGATIQWLRDQLGLLNTAAESEALANSVADTAGVYLVPAFVGLSAPYWQPEARGAILGLTPTTNRAHIVRAALEAIAYLVNDVLREMRDNASVALSAVYADGGAVRNRFLMQFTADITRLQVRAAGTPELSPLGAVLACLLGMGVYRSLDDLERLPASYTTYTPTMPAERAEALIAGWRQAVARILVTG
ncbi:MAG: FGGY family carbohydrate kinase [Anaerolineae bacterium]